MFHHLAHLKEFNRGLKVGYIIRRGQELGQVGKTGTQYAHCHYEVKRMKPDIWTQYTRGLTREQVEARYLDPTPWINKHEKIPAPYTTYSGYEYLDPIDRSGRYFHPGIDINEGFGDEDEGNTVKSPVYGEIVYIGRLDGGWGNHIWIKELEEFPKIDGAFGLKHAGKIFLSVQEKGEAWYVTLEGVRFYMGSTPEEMLEFVQKHGVGISVEDLNKIPKGR